MILANLGIFVNNEILEYVKDSALGELNIVSDVSILKPEESGVSEYNPVNTFCITDNRETADIIREWGYGFAVYITSENREESFPDALYAIESFENMTINQIDRMLLRYLELPWSVLETTRCIVREMTEDDVDDLYRIYDDPDVKKYLEPLFEDREKEIGYITDYRKYQYRFYEYGFWMVIDKADNKVIGRAGLTNREGFDNVELGYVFDREYRNKGYAEEVCKAIIEYAKDELFINIIDVYVHPDNLRSINLLRKLNFRECEKRVINSDELIRFSLGNSEADVLI